MRAKAAGAKSPGRGLIISTPKGYNFFHEMYHYKENDPDWKSYTFDYTQSPILDIAEIEAEMLNMDPFKFASEYKASFKESGKNVFYCFDRDKHVKDDYPEFRPPTSKHLKDGEDVHVFIDFNVGIMAASSHALRGGQLHGQDEFMGHPDTETLAKTLVAKYEGHKIYAYPDPSGRSRKSSSPVGRTDFSILNAAGIQTLARHAAPGIADSVQAVNRKLLNAKGIASCFVRPRQKGLILSLERTKWVENNPDLAVIDKSEGIEHYSDGYRYGVEFLFPVEAGTKLVKRGVNF